LQLMGGSMTPFDHFEKTREDSPGTKSAPFAALHNALRAVSAITLALAFIGAAFVLALHLPHSKDFLRHLHVNPPAWSLKSAWPLIFIGTSYFTLLLTLPRTRTQRLLGFMVCAAFISWGAEQFVPAPEIVSLIDDIIVFVFVLDLSLMIRGNLKSTATHENARN